MPAAPSRLRYATPRASPASPSANVVPWRDAEREKISSCRSFSLRLRVSEVVRESDAGEDSSAKRWRGPQAPQDHPLRRRRAKPDEGRR